MKKFSGLLLLTEPGGGGPGATCMFHSLLAFEGDLSWEAEALCLLAEGAFGNALSGGEEDLGRGGFPGGAAFTGGLTEPGGGGPGAAWILHSLFTLGQGAFAAAAAAAIILSLSLMGF